MGNHRTIITTLALAAALGALAAPAASSPLLSGYGGPGAGAQQLIGAGLVNGGGGRGGPGSSGGGSSSGSATGSTASGGASNSEGGSAAEDRSAAGGRREGSPSGRGRRASAGAGAGRRSASGASSNAVPASTLGLSGGELLLALLLFAGLLAVALLTWRLARLKLRAGSVDGGNMNLGGGH